MKLLLDSHVLLWLINDSARCGTETRSMIADAQSEVAVSVVSVWELGLKYRKGKQPYSIDELLTAIRLLEVDTLSLLHRHLSTYATVSLDHHDPFDTMLVAQSVAEGAKLVTVDQRLLRSPYPVLDAAR